MITLYSGTPGAGKSLHVARKIYERLRTTKRDVIATFPINMDIVTKNGKKKAASFIYCDITDISTEYLIKYALENHKLGKENQTLVVIDECQIIFNPREFSRTDRLKWIVFFTQHRKLGYDFILVSQFDRLIDRQIRCLLEYNVIHRKANNLGILWLFPIKFFVAVSVWYGAKVKCGQEFFLYRKKFGKMYDSFMMFDDDFKKYIKESGNKVSAYNLEKLGLDKVHEKQETQKAQETQEAPETQSKQKDEASSDTNINESELLSGEVERYADIFVDLPEEEGSSETINAEVSEALFMSKVNMTVGEQLYCNKDFRLGRNNDGTLFDYPPVEEAYKTDTDVDVAEAVPPKMGVGGSPIEGGAEPEPPNRLARIWEFLNTPIHF